jgi:transketolase
VLSCLKPLDQRAILAAGSECRAVLTVEEHALAGGLGEACAGLLLGAGATPRFRALGILDEETYPGSQADIFRHYGISLEGIVAAARDILSPLSHGVPAPQELVR